MTLLDDTHLLDASRSSTATAGMCDAVVAVAHQAIRSGGDLEVVLRALLGLGGLDRTDLRLAAVKCRQASQVDDPDGSWRVAALNLELAALTGIFVSS